MGDHQLRATGCSYGAGLVQSGYYLFAFIADMAGIDSAQFVQWLAQSLQRVAVGADRRRVVQSARKPNGTASQSFSNHSLHQADFTIVGRTVQRVQGGYTQGAMPNETGRIQGGRRHLQG